MSRSLTNVSLGLAKLNQSTKTVQRSPPRNHYTFFIGPDRTKLTVHSQIFNLYAPDFHENTSSWPSLSPHAAKIAFDFCGSRYLGYVGAYDVETLRNCFDVYNCADAWGIQSLKTHVCQVICASNILVHVDDYAAFLAQLYQLYAQFMGKDESTADALTKCLRTIAKEHGRYTGVKRGTLRSQLQNPPSREEEMQDILSTEFLRLDRDCYCKFCKYQRKNYTNGRKGPFWAYRVAKADLAHDSKAIWSAGLTPIGILFDLVFNGWTFAVLGWLLVFLGTKEVIRESIKVLWAVLAYLSLLVVVQFALLVLVSSYFLFSQVKPVFETPVRFIKWVAWKIAFPPIPKSERELAQTSQVISSSLGVFFALMFTRIAADYMDGNGPFDQLTMIVLKDNTWLALRRIFYYYFGVRTASTTDSRSWVPPFAAYLERIEKGEFL
ncbi:hypothetical protein TWF506_004624 [Arthrobotrys conoides]|uniref:Uncharacterized protein n=1 Tax=Arthrobotrys conoides TaxID=74498 RepID=A0AAN8RNZ5_9PEZI